MKNWHYYFDFVRYDCVVILPLVGAGMVHAERGDHKHKYHKAWIFSIAFFKADLTFQENLQMPILGE